MIAASVRLLVCAILLAAGCYRGTTSLAESERKHDAAWLGMRLAHPDDGRPATELLVKMAAREPEARAVLADRLATARPGPVRDRLDAAVRARLPDEPALGALVAALASDVRPPFRAAAARLAAPR